MHFSPHSGTPSRAIASTSYDTAWVAAVPHPVERRDPRFPGALSWIATHQWPDGSWGSAVEYVHDRIICTLSALIPMARFGRRESDALQIRRGERYLWQNAHLMLSEPCELVGFELLLPTLVKLASAAGVKVPPQLDVFAAERSAKLALLPPHLLYSPQVTIAHSLEFLGDDVNPLQLIGVRAANGSIGNSPAATAFLLHHVDDAAAVSYLERCLHADGGAGVPVLDPCETFEALWTAYHDWLSGTPADAVLSPELRTQLIAQLAAHGVSLSPSFPVPDADDTAIALLLLHEAGVAVAPDALAQFERDEYFVSFPYERHPSTGVNIHVLQALLRFPNYRERDTAIAKIVAFLRQSRLQRSYWRDKWHLSPLYATGRALLALNELAASGLARCDDLIADAATWLVQTQNEDGSWGFYHAPTVEESAYAVCGLAAVADAEPDVREAIERGRAYIAAHQHAPRPPLWLDKCLYHPHRIVDAAVRAALSPEQLHSFGRVSS